MAVVRVKEDRIDPNDLLVAVAIPRLKELEPCGVLSVPGWVLSDRKSYE